MRTSPTSQSSADLPLCDRCEKAPRASASPYCERCTLRIDRAVRRAANEQRDLGSKKVLRAIDRRQTGPDPFATSLTRKERKQCRDGKWLTPAVLRGADIIAYRATRRASSRVCHAHLQEDVRSELFLTMCRRAAKNWKPICGAFTTMFFRYSKIEARRALNNVLRRSMASHEQQRIVHVGRSKAEWNVAELAEAPPPVNENRSIYDFDPEALPPHVRDAFRSLSARERVVLRLRFVSGLPAEVVARDIGCSNTEVYRIQKDALRKIRREAI